jgi:hypothetical protein
MTDDPRIQQLLDQLSNGHVTPEEVCRLWAEVRDLRDATASPKDAAPPPAK